MAAETYPMTSGDSDVSEEGTPTKTGCCAIDCTKGFALGDADKLVMT